MTNFERLIRSKEDLAKQLVSERCCTCFLVSKCGEEHNKRCISETIEWLNKESELE